MTSVNVRDADPMQLPHDDRLIALEALLLVEARNQARLDELAASVGERRPLWGRDGADVLRAAIDTDDPRLVGRILALGASVDTVLANEEPRLTAASYGVQQGRLEAASFLVEQGGSAGGLPAVLVEKLAQRAALRTSAGETIFPPALNASDRERVALALLPLMASGCDQMLLEKFLGAGIRVDFRGPDGCTLLHHAVSSREREPETRSAFVERLLELGAIPERRTAAGLDAYQLADPQTFPEVAALLRKRGRDFGPRQSREARRQGVRDLCFYYSKADGFIYRIGTPDPPFLIGGDHDGAYPRTAAEARAEVAQLLNEPSAAGRLGGFARYLDLLVEGKEFSYDDLLRQAGPCTLHSFAERPPWGWAAD